MDRKKPRRRAQIKNPRMKGPNKKTAPEGAASLTGRKSCQIPREDKWSIWQLSLWHQKVKNVSYGENKSEPECQMSDQIFIGGGGEGYGMAQNLLLALTNRHGLIAGGFPMDTKRQQTHAG